MDYWGSLAEVDGRSDEATLLKARMDQIVWWLRTPEELEEYMDLGSWAVAFDMREQFGVQAFIMYLEQFIGSGDLLDIYWKTNDGIVEEEIRDTSSQVRFVIGDTSTRPNYRDGRPDFYEALEAAIILYMGDALEMRNETFATIRAVRVMSRDATSRLVGIIGSDAHSVGVAISRDVLDAVGLRQPISAEWQVDAWRIPVPERDDIWILDNEDGSFGLVQMDFSVDDAIPRELHTSTDAVMLIEYAKLWAVNG